MQTVLGELSDTAEWLVGTSGSSADARALAAEGWAVGTQRGVPVTEGSPYYENNSLYWSQQVMSTAGDLAALVQQAQTAIRGADDAAADAVMGKVFKEHGYVCDPHTASGWAAAEDYISETGDLRPMVVLSTASPYKFPAAVLEALGGGGNSTTAGGRVENSNAGGVGSRLYEAIDAYFES